jgi:acyl dehydratase
MSLTTHVHLTRADLLAYADASGDANPIHRSDEAARAVGLPGVLAHGMLTLGLACSAVADWAGSSDAVVEFGGRFVKPVLVDADTGADLTIELAPADTADPDTGLTRVDITVTAAGVKVLGMARASVRLP